ncbi:MAG: cupin domain-containing protein [Streptomycetaceae bacterium]|nr:cupin domain-containing protein [Streptomycetaceae bacterium]
MSFLGQNDDRVVYVAPGEGPSRWAFGDRYTIKSGEHNTGKMLYLMEAVVPPGGGPPPHVHHWEEEAFYVLDGAVEIRDKGGDREVPAGGFVYVPRGTMHSFTNVGVEPAKMLILLTPGGKDRFFNQAGVPAEDGSGPPPESQRLADVELGFRIGPDFGDEYLTR